MLNIQTIAKNGPLRLLGKVQNYSWGGCCFIPELVRLMAKPNESYAEYWMGAHDKAPSDILLDDGLTIPLNTVIENEPQLTLGIDVASQFGRLPFLFKVLDVREMLSIQVHPTKLQAEEGFARENSMGLPLDSERRNYKDDNHKPELQVALSDFWLLHGFKAMNELRQALFDVVEFQQFITILDNGGYYSLYKHVMEMTPDSIHSILDPLASRIIPKYYRGELTESSPDYWAAKAMGNGTGDYDKGIFSIYFFNLIVLKPGQAIFQDAGIPHAALHGQAIEIMANSDNVIRGGLTSKYTDARELLSIVSFEGIRPEVLESTKYAYTGEWIYRSPCPDFLLSRIRLTSNESFLQTTYSAEILLVISGVAIIDIAGKRMPLKKGDSVIIFAGKKYRIHSGNDELLIFRATVPRLRPRAKRN